MGRSNIWPGGKEIELTTKVRFCVWLQSSVVAKSVAEECQSSCGFISSHSGAIARPKALTLSFQRGLLRPRRAATSPRLSHQLQTAMDAPSLLFDFPTNFKLLLNAQSVTLETSNMSNVDTRHNFAVPRVCLAPLMACCWAAIDPGFQ